MELDQIHVNIDKQPPRNGADLAALFLARRSAPFLMLSFFDELDAPGIHTSPLKPPMTNEEIELASLSFNTSPICPPSLGYTSFGSRVCDFTDDPLSFDDILANYEKCSKLTEIKPCSKVRLTRKKRPQKNKFRPNVFRPFVSLEMTELAILQMRAKLLKICKLAPQD